MRLSDTIAANLSAAAAAERESAAAAAANSNSTITNVPSSNANSSVSTATTSIQALSSNHSTLASINSNPPGKSMPKDTQVIAAILKEMGILEYEPRVLPQLVEFAYRYSSHVLEDAQLFSSYARKKVIDTDDVSIAVQMQMDRSFIGPPSRDILLEIAKNKNTQPLPSIKSHNGMRLPADRYSLVASNLRLASNDKKEISLNKPFSRTGTSLLTKYSTMNQNSNKSSSGNNFVMTNNEGPGNKRRLEDEN